MGSRTQAGRIWFEQMCEGYPNCCAAERKAQSVFVGGSPGHTVERHVAGRYNQESETSMIPRSSNSGDIGSKLTKKLPDLFEIKDYLLCVSSENSTSANFIEAMFIALTELQC